MDVAVPGAVEVDDGRPALRVVEEVQVVGKLREVHDLLAVEGLLRHRTVYHFTDAQAVMVVDKRGRNEKPPESAGCAFGRGCSD